MSKIVLSLVISLLASSAYAQSAARIAVSAGTDAARPQPAASATAHTSAGTDAPQANKPSSAAAKPAAGSETPKRLIPQPRKEHQRPAADTTK